MKDGASTQSLSGNNNFSGGTDLAGGTLAINSASSLGAVGGALAFTGTSTLRTDASFSSARNYSINSGVTGTIDTNNNTFTQTGVISGDGNLSKSGAGSLIVTGTNTYLGATTINSGILQVGNNGTTGTLGAGQVNIGDAATLRFDRSDPFSVSNSINLAGVGGQQGFVNVFRSGQQVTLTGAITSAGAGLTKSGLGKLVVDNASNSFTSDVRIQSGILETATLSFGGSNSSLGKGSIFIGDDGSAGTLRYTGTTANTDRLQFNALQATGTNNIIDVVFFRDHPHGHLKYDRRRCGQWPS